VTRSGPPRAGRPLRRSDRAAVARYAAPAVFLAAVTIAVVIVRAGLNGGDVGGTTSFALTTTAAAPTTTGATKTRRPKKRYYVIQSGDTFGTVAAKFNTSVEALQALNPGVSSNSMSVGERLRVK
jgi:LysM repeat protein